MSATLTFIFQINPNSIRLVVGSLLMKDARVTPVKEQSNVQARLVDSISVSLGA